MSSLPPQRGVAPMAQLFAEEPGVVMQIAAAGRDGLLRAVLSGTDCGTAHTASRRADCADCAVRSRVGEELLDEPWSELRARLVRDLLADAPVAR